MIKKIKKHFKEIIEIKTTPHEIALGFAVGTGIAILPTFGLGVFIGVLILLIFERISKVSMFIAFAIWNPIVLIPMAGLSYGIGDFILTKEPIIKFQIEFLNQIFVYTRRYFVGNLILTATLSTLSYGLVYFLVKKYKKKEIPILQKPLEI